ncbi:MAG TPA: hypothetical protein VFQ92_00005, partial [Blastocatellia bacterium]|nr:hypothetical protein [Blastocatellia bacterium]
MLKQFYTSQMLFLLKHRSRFSVSLYAAAMKAILTLKRLYHEAAQDERPSIDSAERLAALEKAHSLLPRG